MKKVTNNGFKVKGLFVAKMKPANKPNLNVQASEKINRNGKKMVEGRSVEKIAVNKDKNGKVE